MLAVSRLQQSTLTRYHYWRHDDSGNHLHAGEVGGMITELPIKHLLQEWAAWSRQGSGVVKGYPASSNFSRLSGTPGARSPNITDETAERVDMAVTRLRMLKPSQADIIQWYYIERKTLTKIGRRRVNGERRPMGRDRASQMLRLAENGVELLLTLEVLPPTQLGAP